MSDPKIEQSITVTGITSATALHLTFDNKFFEDFKEKYQGLENCTYRDIIIVWEGAEYWYSIDRFKKLLGLAP